MWPSFSCLSPTMPGWAGEEAPCSAGRERGDAGQWGKGWGGGRDIFQEHFRQFCCWKSRCSSVSGGKAGEGEFLRIKMHWKGGGRRWGHFPGTPLTIFLGLRVSKGKAWKRWTIFERMKGALKGQWFFRDVWSRVTKDVPRQFFLHHTTFTFQTYWKKSLAEKTMIITKMISDRPCGLLR